jgi:esterase/lipase superfamily enzyme
MPVVRHGQAGTPLVYASSSGGDHTEFEGFGMAEAAAPWLDAGLVQVFAFDACGPSTLFDDTLTPRERIARYAALERYVARELLPWVRSETGRNELAVVGASYGAFVAANLLFKHPDVVSVACGLGGVYGLWHRLEGYHDDDVYFHTPLEYLPRLEDPRILQAIRSTRGLALFGAERDPWLASTQHLQQVLRERELPHAVEIWPAPADHHERWWRRQLVRFLERHLERPA